MIKGENPEKTSEGKLLESTQNNGLQEWEFTIVLGWALSDFHDFTSFLLSDFDDFLNQWKELQSNKYLSQGFITWSFIYFITLI